MQFLELFFKNIDEMFTDIINLNFFFIILVKHKHFVNIRMLLGDMF